MVNTLLLASFIIRLTSELYINLIVTKDKQNNYTYLKLHNVTLILIITIYQIVK